MQVDELSGETPGMSLRLTIPLPVRRCAVRSYVPAIRDRSEAGRTLSSDLMNRLISQLDKVPTRKKRKRIGQFQDQYPATG